MLTTVAGSRVYDFSHCVGMYAQTGQGFYAPTDFVLADSGVIYVANHGGLSFFQRITKLTVDHEYLGDLGSGGEGDGQFNWLAGITVDRDENVYASDAHLHRVSVLDSDGNFLRKWGTQGSGDGQFNAPCGIKFNKEGNLFVSDSHNHRIQIFAQNGKFLRKWGGQGTAEGQLDLPWGICFDHQGNLLVADWGNKRVQRFTPDGQFLASIGGPDSGPGELQRPSSVAVDSDGDIYVTDWKADKLHIYSHDGEFITSLMGDAQELSPWAKTFVESSEEMVKARRRVNLEPEWRFRRPVSVNVDANDRVYILEIWRARLQVYQKTKEYEEHPLNL